MGKGAEEPLLDGDSEGKEQRKGSRQKVWKTCGVLVLVVSVVWFLMLVCFHTSKEASSPGDVASSLWPAACAVSPSLKGNRLQVDRVVFCASLVEKKPSLTAGLQNRPSEERLWSPIAKMTFELDIARRLAETSAVSDTTREFARRLHAVLVEAGQRLDNLTEAEVLPLAFAKNCGVHNTGFSGLSAEGIREVLLVNGNLREVWGLVYCLSKHEPYVDRLFGRADSALLTSALGAEAGQRAGEATAQRKQAIEEKQDMDYLFPSPDSWVRFGFNQNMPKALGGERIWEGARQAAPRCRETDLKTDSPWIYPPLSQREISAECGNKTLPCQMKWYPGEGCFNIVEDNIFTKRCERFGYRVTAGPSGTTANVLQLAKLLGFAPEDMLALRSTMMAWLVASDDHSVIEVLLGAEPFLPQQTNYSMQWGLAELDKDDKFADFRKIWPAGLVLRSSWGSVLEGPGAEWLS